MENEILILNPLEDELTEVFNADEFVSDFSFQFNLFHMKFNLDLDNDNYGFCIES